MVAIDLDCEARNELRQCVALAKRSGLALEDLKQEVIEIRVEIVGIIRERLKSHTFELEPGHDWQMMRIADRMLDQLLRFERMFQRIHNNSMNG